MVCGEFISCTHEHNEVAHRKISKTAKPLIIKSRWSESNRRPADYESAALPLSYTGRKVSRAGFEPATR